MSLDLPFNLFELPETPRPSAGRRTASRTVEVVDQFAYGHGVLRPFVRDGQGDWAHAKDVSLVRANVGQVLGTVASSPLTRGELPWMPEFGSLLPFLRHRNLDESTAELARTYVVEALSTWVKRVRINSATVELDYDNTRLVITIVYDILSTNRRAVVASNQTSRAALPLAA